MIKAVIIDADNTLYSLYKEKAYDEQFSYLENEARIKKERLVERWEILRRRLKRERNPEKRKREYSIRILLSGFGVDSERAEKLAKNSLKVFWARVIKDMKYDQETVNTMQYLKRKYKISIASDEFRAPLRKKLNRVFVDWKRYFRFMITPEIVGEMKPSFEYYEIAMKKLAARPEQTVVIGDSWERDLAPAMEMGIKTVLVSEKLDGTPTHWISRISEAAKIL